MKKCKNEVGKNSSEINTIWLLTIGTESDSHLAFIHRIHRCCLIKVFILLLSFVGSC